MNVELESLTLAGRSNAVFAQARDEAKAAGLTCSATGPQSFRVADLAASVSVYPADQLIEPTSQKRPADRLAASAMTLFVGKGVWDVLMIVRAFADWRAGGKERGES